eukprot:10615397-Lingulodinium_polyedra.AAC.1
MIGRTANNAFPQLKAKAANTMAALFWLEEEVANRFNKTPCEHARPRAVTMWGLAEVFRHARACGQWL